MTSRIWHEDAVITVDENFKNPIFNRCQRFTTAVDTGEDVKNLYDLLMQTSPNNLTADKLRFLLAECYRVSFNANEFKREQALESFRILKATDKPSRLHSVYLTDEKGIEFQMKNFGSKDLVIVISKYFLDNKKEYKAIKKYFSKMKSKMIKKFIFN